MPFRRMLKGVHGPWIVGALETDMLFGHWVLGGVSVVI